MDSLVNDCLLATGQSQTRDNDVDAQAISISILETRITGRYEEAIREHIDGSYLHHYLSDEHSWTDSMYACIDWYSHEHNLKVLKGACLFQRLKFIHDWQPTNSPKLKFAKSTDASIGFCPCCKTTLEDHDHFLRCPSQERTRYLTLRDIRSPISETKSLAGPILSQGLTHWLHQPSEPMPIDTSRYSGRTKLLVQQALDEEERIGWAKAFRGYLSITWCLLEAPHKVSNPYKKSLQPSAWVISTLTNLGTFSKQAMWKDRCTKLHDPTNTSSSTSDLDADIANYCTMLTLKSFSQLTASYSTALSRRFSDLNELTKQDGSAAHAAPIDTFLQSASIGSIPYAISSTHQFPLPHSLSSNSCSISST